MESKFVDYYQLLEVNIVSSKEALKAAYKRLSVQYHPDNGGDEGRFSQITEAYHILLNDHTRKEYLQQWKQHKFLHNEFCQYPFGSSYDDLAFQPIREAVHEYMFYIMNKEYDKAYLMLCQASSRRIFKRDFVKWQEMVGQVHEILSYESALDTLSYDEKDGIHVIFQVKVREHNMLLNRQEEDFFKRVLVFEDHTWKVKLPDIHIGQIIKKYKQIVDVNKRRSKRMLKSQNHKYHTRYLDVASLMQNVEYEFLRFKRYSRDFGLLSIQVRDMTFKDEKKLVRIMEMTTRITDSFCITENDTIIILLPETGKRGMDTYLKKLVVCLEDSGYHPSCCKSVICDQSVNSSKELMNKVMVRE